MKAWMKRVLMIGLIIGMFVLLDVKCPILAVLKVPCPACGMTRAWMAVLSGDLKRAFELHPLFLLGPVIVYVSVMYDQWEGLMKDVLCIGLGILFLMVYLM